MITEEHTQKKTLYLYLLSYEQPEEVLPPGVMPHMMRAIYAQGFWEAHTIAEHLLGKGIPYQLLQQERPLLLYGESLPAVKTKR